MAPQASTATSTRTLVTGGAGFLGTHLVSALLNRGNTVICSDDLSTGAIASIAMFRDHPAFSFLKHDIAEPLNVDVDEIYNLACPASPSKYQADPIGTTRTAVLGAFNVMDLARRSGARVLQASTSEVYGDPTVSPQSESYWGNVNPVGPRSCYDEGKRCAETIMFDYHRQHGVDVKIARIFNTYGPGMQLEDGRAIPNFIAQALRGEDLTIYGDGTQTRSFCYVDDMIDAFLRLMATPASLTGPMNLGNPTEMTVTDLAQTILRLTGSASGIQYLPLPGDDPMQRRPDTTLALEALNWRATTSLEAGLTTTISAFQRAIASGYQIAANVG